MRVLFIPIFAAFLVACAAQIPVAEAPNDIPATATLAVDTQDDGQTAMVIETQNDIPSTTTQPDPTRATKAKLKTKKPQPSAPKPATVSTTAQKDTTNLTMTNVGSPEKLAKERAEEERRERHLKQVIESICRDC